MESSKCRAFMIAAETGSFSKAAEILNYTPSGVSQLVTALERELGFRLLGRSRRGVQITKNGERMMLLIKEFIMKENSIYEMAAEINGLMIGNVTVAAYSSISANWLAAVIKNFQEDYPDVKINLMEGIRQEVCSWIEDKTADVAFLSYKDNMQYEWIPLAEDRMVAVLPAGHKMAEKKAYPVSECQSENFIMPALGHDDDVTELFRKYELTPEIKFSTFENFSAMAMIEQGMGMSIMNELITKRWECDVVKLPLEPPQHITLGMALLSLEEASPAVKRFVAYSEKKLSKVNLNNDI